MKSFIRKIFDRLGYEVGRKGTTLNAMNVQESLIEGREPVVFDVGAFDGSTTKRYRELFPFASIYSFEPFPETFEQLKINTAGEGSKTSLHNLAISDKKGVAVFNANAFSATNSLLPTDTDSSIYWGQGVLETEKQVEVNTTTIDAFCDENTISKIDILKLDVQGAEFSALMGAKEMLSKQSISLVYLEVITAPTYQGQHKLHEYFNLFASFGYEFFDYYNPERKSRQLIQADMIFVNKPLMQGLKENLQ
ncbi:MAG: FkbM family methyltransferase [Deltaproteobacteria bacterium]|nr:FkbM family methyltransferase [Deltaproteobacteria bacterium]MBT7887592.1 FkbM family methyltransferase [Deltaproteobacteria bacterium]